MSFSRNSILSSIFFLFLSIFAIVVSKGFEPISLLIRSQVLYPVELRDQLNIIPYCTIACIIITFFNVVLKLTPPMLILTYITFIMFVVLKRFERLSNVSKTSILIHWTIEPKVPTVRFEPTCDQLLFQRLMRARRYVGIMLTMTDSNPQPCG